MKFSFELETPSDSPYIEKIWRTQSERAGSFTSIAAIHWEIVFTRYQGKTAITVRGPETKASLEDCPADADFFGIVFKLGTFMPHLPTQHLVDGGINLPIASNNGFWLDSAAWQIPDYDNADTFVEKLVRESLLVQEPVVIATLQGYKQDLSLRTLQRRFVQATGITHKTIQQIQRAHQAMSLLEQGASILDTAYEVGYYDQAHLTNALKRFMGQTPAQILQPQPE